MIFYEKTIDGSTEKCGTYFGIYPAIHIGLDLRYVTPPTWVDSTSRISWRDEVFPE